MVMVLEHKMKHPMVTPNPHPNRGGAIESSLLLHEVLPVALRVPSGLTTNLLQRDRHKDEFLASLAHELRNPLAPIRYALDVMGQMTLDAEVDNLRILMNRQVDQLAHLIDDLSNATRINCGKFIVNKEATLLGAILQSAVEASKTSLAELGQTLTVPAWIDTDIVFGDRFRLIQVFTNLLNNSAKYSAAGGHVAISVDHEPGFITIRVQDNGIGIAVDQLERIFELYVQAGDSRERHARGLGIGLFLVKTLVELHGGTVRAESDGLGKGSCFSVRLPTLE
jgi:two-component system, sensor histidine kinase